MNDVELRDTLGKIEAHAANTHRELTEHRIEIRGELVRIDESTKQAHRRVSDHLADHKNTRNAWPTWLSILIPSIIAIAVAWLSRKA